MRAFTTSLLFVTSLLVGCGSDTTSEPGPAADTGSDSLGAETGATPTCAEVCAVVSSTTCSNDATIQDAATCTTECETWRAKGPACTDKWDAFVRCCASRGVAVECSDRAISFEDCDDACKVEGEQLSLIHI